MMRALGSAKRIPFSPAIDRTDPIEAAFKAFLERKELGFGQVLLPFRIALTGEGGGPSMFAFAAFLGKEITLDRLNKGMARIAQQRTKS